MKATQTKAAKSLALVSAPWPLYDRPTIQLGPLSAWIKGALPDCPVDAHYAYLNVANGIGYCRACELLCHVGPK